MTFDEEFPSFEDEFFHGKNQDLVRKEFVEQNCLDKKRVLAAIETIGPKIIRERIKKELGFDE